MINIDIPKAKEITKDRLRAERTPLLQALDIKMMKNLSDTTKLAEIEAEKQRLRDITSLVDTLETVEELKEVKAKALLAKAVLVGIPEVVVVEDEVIA